MQMFVAWYAMVDTEGDAESKNLLDALCYMTRSQEKVGYLAESCLFVCLSVLAKQGKITEYSEVVEWFRALFALPVEYPHECFALVARYMKVVLTGGEMSDIAMQLCCFIGIMCEEKRSGFPVDAAELLVDALMPQLLRLNVAALTCYMHVIQFLGEDSAGRVFSVFGSVLVKKAMKNGPFLSVRNGEVVDVIEFDSSTTCATSLRFWPETTFADGIKLETASQIHEHVKLDDLMSPEMFAVISIITAAGAPREKIGCLLLDVLVSVVEAHKGEPHEFDLSVVLLLCCSDMIKSVRDENMEVLGSKPIFDPAITAFGNCEGFSIVSSLRYHVIRLAFKVGFIGKLLRKWMMCPYLFADIVHQIAQNADEFALEPDQVPEFCEALMVCACYHQQIHYEETNLEAVEFARTSTLLMISRFFASMSQMTMFFSNDSFLSFFLSFAFESRLCEFVFAQLNKYLSQGSDIISLELREALEHIIVICTASFEDDRAVRLVHDMLGCVNGALAQNRSIKDSFIPFCEMLFASLNRVTSANEVRQNYVIQCVNFFSLVATKAQLGSAEMQTLSTSIERTFGNDLSSQLKRRLIQLIAGDCLPSLEPTFHIKNPRVMKMFLRLCLKDSDVLQMFDFLGQLIRYSRLNAITCRTSDFDTMLIMLVKEQQNEQLVKCLLTLFEQIAVQTSSVSLVQRYISLFSPINGRYIPKFQGMYLETMRNIVETNARMPLAALPMTKGQGFAHVSGISATDLNGGFTVVFWICLEPCTETCKLHAIRISDNKEAEIGVFVSSSVLYVSVKISDFTRTGKVDRHITFNEWIFVSLTFREVDDERTVILPTVGSYSCPCIDVMPIRFCGNALSVQVAGMTLDATGADSMAAGMTRIGSFGMYGKMLKEEVGAVLDCGPKMLGSLPAKPIFFFTTEAQSGYLSIRRLPETVPSVELMKQQDEVQSSMSFTEVLTDFCKIEILLPLIAQVDMTTEDGKSCVSVTKTVIELLGRILSMSPHAEMSFYAANGFGMISHLLQQASEESITYSLYQQFYEMIGRINHPGLQRSLVNKVLIDPDIWIRADPGNHKRIVRHWYRVISQSLPEVLEGRFQELLFIMRTYYWYEAVSEERDMVCEMRRMRGDTDPPVRELRQILAKLAMTLVSHTITKTEFQCLMSHCLTIADTKEVIDLLGIFRELAQLSPSPLERIQSEVDLITPLCAVLARRSGAVTQIVCETVVSLYNNGLKTKRSLTEQVILLMQQLSPTTVTEAMFTDMTAMVGGNTPELFPLWCWMAASGCVSEPEVIRALDTFHPGPKFGVDLTWVVWPVVLCYKTRSGDIFARFMQFICRCTEKHWQWVYGIIHTIGFALNEDSNDMKYRFLRAITTVIEEDDTDITHVSVFFALVQHFLFIRDCTEKSPYLEALMDTSPFRDEKKQSLESEDTRTAPQEMTPDESYQVPVNLLDFQNGLLSNDMTVLDVRFGIRMDENRVWVDHDLAMRVLSLREKYRQEQFITLDLLASAFLVRSYPEWVITHLGTVVSALTPAQKVSMSRLMGLVVRHAVAAGVTSEVLTSLLPHIPDNFGRFIADKDVIPGQEMASYIKEVMKSLKRFMGMVAASLVSSLEIGLEDIVSISDEQITALLEEFSSRRRTNKNNWSRLWRRIAVDPAPWSVNLENRAYFKRDKTLCRYSCTFKVKRNWKFSDHKKASLARDYGSFVTADIIMSKETAEREKCSPSPPPLELLELTRVKNEDTSASFESVDCATRGLPVNVITAGQTRKAVFTVTPQAVKLWFSVGSVKRIPLVEIVQIYFRRIIHRPNAMEIVTQMGRSFLIHFIHHDSRTVLQIIGRMDLVKTDRIQLTSFADFTKQHVLTSQWARGLVSNFEYLMHLNTMSGRTFNDLCQYPVFPWVLVDYTSDELDLDDPKSFRRFDRPVGAMDEDRLREFEHARRERMELGDGNYLYASTFSCMLTVCQYLVRMEPMTSTHIEIQSGRFDHGPRLFTSVADAFTSVVTNQNDMRELIPEFYFCPEFLVNSNHFDLGSNTKGKVEDVVLPPWAHGSPVMFVYKMRKALESDYAAEHIHSWIDLIWGIKQRGPEAVAAKNTFRPELYDTVWDVHGIHERRQVEIEAFLMHVGQIPPQLFTIPHPARVPRPVPPPLLSSPFVVASHVMTKAVIARLECVEIMLYRLVVIDAQGKIVTHMINFGRCAVSSTRSNDGDKRRSTKAATDGACPVVTSSEREIKGFEDSVGDVHLRGNSIAFLPNSRIAVVSGTRRLFYIDTTRCTLDPILNRVVGVYVHEFLSAVAGTNAAVDIYRCDPTANTTPWMTIPSHGDSITCHCVCKKFYIAVTGTRDGTLILTSLSKGSTVRVINLDGARPHLVAVTGGWGFIVTYAKRVRSGKSEDFIFVFNVNGERLGCAQIDSPITSWSLWTCIRGFDYITFGDSSGRLFAFEVFHCHPGDSVHHCRSPILMVSYIRDLSCIIAVTNDGRFVVLPHIAN